MTKSETVGERILDELTYINYAHNRLLAPDISPKEWANIFGQKPVERMEQRLKEEHNE